MRAGTPRPLAACCTGGCTGGMLPTPQNASPDPLQDLNLGLMAGSVDTTSQNHESHAQQQSPARNHTRAKPGKHAKESGEKPTQQARERATTHSRHVTGISRAREPQKPAARGSQPKNGWAGGDLRPRPPHSPVVRNKLLSPHTSEKCGLMRGATAASQLMSFGAEQACAACVVEATPEWMALGVAMAAWWRRPS